MCLSVEEAKSELGATPLEDAWSYLNMAVDFAELPDDFEEIMHTRINSLFSPLFDMEEQLMMRLQGQAS